MIRTHLRSNVVGYLALFVALGGTATAAVTLPRDSVGSRQIRGNAVRASEIARNAVQSRGIAEDAVGSSEIEDNDIRLADISAGARSSLQGAQGPAGPPGRRARPGRKPQRHRRRRPSATIALMRPPDRTRRCSTARHR